MSKSEGRLGNMEQVYHQPELPLAIYREIAAHLGQIAGVTVELLPQSTPTFDYRLSQVGAIKLQYSDDLSPADRAQVQAILTYYGDRYGNWIEAAAGC